MGRRLAYLTLEAPRAGQASYTHVHEMIGELRQLGWSVDLFAAERGGASTSAGWTSRLLDYVWVQVGLAIGLRRFDALYVRAHPMAAPIAVLAFLLRVPVVQEINGRPEDLAITYRRLAVLLPLLRRLYALQLRLAAQVIAVTDGLGSWATAFAGHRRVSVVPNGANTRLFRPDGPRVDLGFPYVVFVGGLVAWHGIATMIAATREAAWPTGVRLVVIGDGPERDQLAGCDAARVVWLGRLPYEAIPAYIRGSVAALCLIEDPDGRSSTGVAPLKLFEAMACGTPVVVSDLPFQAELVRSVAAGRVIPAGDAPRLAAVIGEAAADAETSRALGENGARYVLSSASWELRARQTSNILLQVCGRSAGKQA